jgi:hypothetical protein
MSYQIALLLETWCTTAGTKEISGVGTVEKTDEGFKITSVYLCAGGSEALTQIEPSHIMEVVQQGVAPSAIKLWWHRHPVGDGKPGPHCWSGTDEGTIQNSPLGSSPALVEWSISIVRTPLGWVGRVDNHKNGKAVHVEVKQILPPKEHQYVKKLIVDSYQHPRSYIGALYNEHSDIGQLPSKQKSFDNFDVGGLTWRVNQWLANRPQKGQGKKKLRHVLEKLQLEWSELNEIAYRISGGEMPEDVAGDYALDVFELVDLQVLTQDQAMEAYKRLGGDIGPHETQ